MVLNPQLATRNPQLKQFQYLVSLALAEQVKALLQMKLLGVIYIYM